MMNKNEEEDVMSWEDAFRPKVRMGIMKIDEDECTSCGLCVDNCPFRCWQQAEAKSIPALKDGYACFSCFNCMIACNVDAVSIEQVYHVEEGYFATYPPSPLPVRMPMEPRDANSQLAEWTPIERLILERRSVRNYRNRPVPEPLIRRVLEAGRFAPSAMNAQPWRFVVVTNKALIDEMNDFVAANLKVSYDNYMDDEKAKATAASWETNPNHPPAPDPRVAIGGWGTFGRKLVPVLLGAPVVIFLLTTANNSAAVSIAAQNMVLAAKSLGLGTCYVGFASGITRSPEIMRKLGIEKPWTLGTTLTLGYPRFKQEGLVPREYRPVTWIKEGSEEQIID